MADVLLVGASSKLKGELSKVWRISENQCGPSLDVQVRCFERWSPAAANRQVDGKLKSLGDSSYEFQSETRLQERCCEDVERTKIWRTVNTTPSLESSS